MGTPERSSWSRVARQRSSAVWGRLIDLDRSLETRRRSGYTHEVALYQRDRDDAISAIVAPTAGPREGYLQQYSLFDSGGRIGARFVRPFGRFSATTVREEGEIEAVQSTISWVPVPRDEAEGIHKVACGPRPPRTPSVNRRTSAHQVPGDREGIAIYALADGTGYLVYTDQLDRDSDFHVFAREGTPGNAHNHSRIAVLRRRGRHRRPRNFFASAWIGPAARRDDRDEQRPPEFPGIPLARVAMAMLPKRRLSQAR